MKKVRYQKEISKYKDLFLFLLFSSVIIFLILKNDFDNTIILVPAIAAVLSLCSSFPGFALLYKKILCKSKGTPYEGRITGKTGKSTSKNGYYYELQVLYQNGKIKTPLIPYKYVDDLKSKKCIVYEYKNMTYVDGYQLCCNGEKPVNIRIINDQRTV